MSDKNRTFIDFQGIIIKYKYIFLVIAAVAMLLPFIDPSDEPVPELIIFFGRFHPLVVHFPVVLVLLLLLFELGHFLKITNISFPVRGFVLGLSFLSCLGSLGLGFFLYRTGEYSGDTMQQHLWGAVLLTMFISVSIFLFLLYRLTFSKKIFYVYLSSIIAANIILIYTSHQGGSLTHGEEYLTEYMPKVFEAKIDWKPKPTEEMLVYDDLIMPFLDKKCMSCHNENKSKGNFIMTSMEYLLKGGKSGNPSLVAGSSSKSEIFRRVTLPLSDDEVMPPEGKTPLTQDEIKILEWWIENGADPELKVEQAFRDQSIEPTVKIYKAELENTQKTSFFNKVNTEKLIQSIESKNKFVLQVDSQDQKKINLSMPFPPASFGDNQLAELKIIYPHLNKASFIGSDITDDAFYHLAQMTSLKELFLQQTQIKGAGLIHLSKLKQLKLLDLSQTDLTDGNLLHVLQISSLEDLFLYETKTSKEVIEAIKENKPALTIHLVRGKMF
jgi:uncharacterized membrane protein